MIELNGPGDPIRECEFLKKIKIFIYLFIILPLHAHIEGKPFRGLEVRLYVI